MQVLQEMLDMSEADGVSVRAFLMRGGIKEGADIFKKGTPLLSNWKMRHGLIWFRVPWTWCILRIVKSVSYSH